jgi:hypothetical protein
VEKLFFLLMDDLVVIDAVTLLTGHVAWQE